ncbi:MAG TPA: hypothetical protein VNN22_15425 [Verrucomicrobiae bacterium]|nr:hypothetical protein [Verrucomicrobiae bacterium]
MFAQIIRDDLAQHGLDDGRIRVLKDDIDDAALFRRAHFQPSSHHNGGCDEVLAPARLGENFFGPNCLGHLLRQIEAGQNLDF